MKNKISRGKIITYLNIISHSVEMVLLTLLYLKDVTTSTTPLSLEGKLIQAVWVIIFLLQGTLAMLPLFYNDDDFYEILWDKISLNFVIIWIGLTICFFPLTSNQLMVSFISPILFFFLKVYSHTFVYRRIKYHDEGNAFVSRSEFFSLHITFSIIEAWISYLLLFSMFQVVVEYADYQSKTGHISESDSVLQGFGITAMVFILSEQTYNLTYYKDVIFSAFDWVIFGGIWYRNAYNSNGADFVNKGAMICFIISGCFTLITLLHSYESALYLKYFSITRKLRE